MDADSAGFLLDRVDLAREALTEAQQIVAKFAQSEDADISNMLGDILAQIERLDATVRSGSYPSS
ncbi:MAG TPA: hypothetical protein VHS06_10275 [Chloroflexota bacterium]|nr:hypothetical protein [Chloroflexota bacterium]